MAINPNLFFYLYGLVSLQMDREWREYQHSWKALNFLSSSSVGVLECNLYVYAFVHIRVFAFLFFFRVAGSGMKEGDFSVHGKLSGSVVVLVCIFCMFLYLYFLHICVFWHFCFSSECSEVKWIGGEVISLFTEGQL